MATTTTTTTATTGDATGTTATGTTGPYAECYKVSATGADNGAGADPFVSAMDTNAPGPVKTENGAPARKSTGSACLDLFFKLLQGIDENFLHELLKAAWSEDPILTMQIIMQCRDATGQGTDGAIGKGVRDASFMCMIWIRSRFPLTYVKLLPIFVNCGRYKDLIELAAMAEDAGLEPLGTRESWPGYSDQHSSGKEYVEIELMADHLREVNDVFASGDQKIASLRKLGYKTLVAKWAITEGTAWDSRKKSIAKIKKAIADARAGKVVVPYRNGAGHRPIRSSRSRYGRRGHFGSTHQTSVEKLVLKLQAAKAKKKYMFAHRIAYIAIPDVPTKRMMSCYRSILSALRSVMSIVERKMCDNEWTTIRYDAVPSRAANLHRMAFTKHDRIGYAAYQRSLKSGDAKVNSKGMYIHELIRSTLGEHDADATVEAQIAAIIDHVREAGTFEGALAVVDTSGSMQGIPLEVAIALGLVVSELNVGAYRGKILSFHSKPTWHQIEGETFHDKASSIRKCPWGGSTNFLETFRLILSVAVNSVLAQEDLPKKVFVFSDMQFDDACGNGAYGRPSQICPKTTWQTILQEFRAAGYEPPKMIFWNLRPNTISFPATTGEDGVVAMVSGFNADLLRLFLADTENIAPMSFLFRAVQDYQVDWVEDELGVKKPVIIDPVLADADAAARVADDAAAHRAAAADHAYAENAAAVAATDDAAHAADAVAEAIAAAPVLTVDADADADAAAADAAAADAAAHAADALTVDVDAANAAYADAVAADAVTADADADAPDDLVEGWVDAAPDADADADAAPDAEKKAVGWLW
jgi:hypothetical protein